MRARRSRHLKRLGLAPFAAASLLAVAGGHVALAGGPAPALSVLLEVQEPGSVDWLDSDDVQGSPGSNDPTPAEIVPAETALLRVTVTNTGHTALSAVHVTEPGCGLDVTVDRLEMGTARVFVCERRALPGDLLETARVAGATPVDDVGPIGDPLGPVEESARLRILSPAFTLLAEAFDYSTHTWIDADANPGSPGSNDGVLARLSTSGTGRFRFTATNTGLVDLVGLRVSDSACPMETRIERLRPQESRVVECDYRDANARATASDALPVTPRGRTSTIPLIPQTEDAGYQPGLVAPKAGVNGKPVAAAVRLALPVDVRTSSPRTVASGDPATLVVRLRVRPGSSALSGVRVRYWRLGRARVFGASSAGTLVTADQVLWEVGHLKPGVWRTVTIRAKATGTGLGRLGGLVQVEAPGFVPESTVLRPTLIQGWRASPRLSTRLPQRGK